MPYLSFPMSTMLEHRLVTRPTDIKGPLCSQNPTKWPAIGNQTAIPEAALRCCFISTPTNMGPSPDADAVRAVVNIESPTSAIEKVDPIASTKPCRVYNITLSGGRSLSLQLSPVVTTRLFRSEQSLVYSEALVIRWIVAKALGTPPLVTQCSRSRTTSPTSEERDQDCPIISTRRATPIASNLCDVLPTLVTYSSSSKKLGAAFNLIEPSNGQPIDTLPELSKTDRSVLDHERGHLARQLSCFTSPSGRFGRAMDVLTPAPTSHASPTDIWMRGPMPPADGGSTSWRCAFHAILESTLRDGEDMAVNISYSRIRSQFARLGHVLDAVTKPCFVVLHPYSNDNALVCITSNEVDRTGESSEPGPSATSLGQAHTETPCTASEPRARLSGLRDWSTCVFGEPIMAQDFYHSVTAEFLDGFGISPRGDLGRRLLEASGLYSNVEESRPGNENESQHQGDAAVVDPQNAYTRVLLYECYHAVVDVLQHFYRPKTQSTDDEMVARRRLTAVLRRLVEVDDAKSFVVKTEQDSTPATSPPSTSTAPQVLAGKQVPSVTVEPEPKRTRRPSTEFTLTRPSKRARGSTPT